VDVLVGDEGLIVGMEEDRVADNVAAEGDVKVDEDAHFNRRDANAENRESSQEYVPIEVYSVFDLQTNAESLVSGIYIGNKRIVVVTQRKLPIRSI
jgi:hypothetical protein